jgi:hypothetical protein
VCERVCALCVCVCVGVEEWVCVVGVVCPCVYVRMCV